MAGFFIGITDGPLIQHAFDAVKYWPHNDLQIDGHSIGAVAF